MAGLLLGFAEGDTIVADRDAPVGSHCLVLCDGIAGQPSIGTWTVELAHRCRGRIVAIGRTTARVRLGNTLTIPGAERIAAVAVDPADGAAVQINADGTRTITLADWSRSLP